MGAGDGRTVIMAAKDFGARAVGIELREDLEKKALTNIQELGLQDHITIIQSDMFTVDVHPADVVFLYLTTSANEKVKPKLESELRISSISNDAVIVSISTVARIVPRGSPTASWAATKTSFHSSASWRLSSFAR